MELINDQKYFQSLSKSELSSINLDNFDKVIKFRSLIKDHNYVFLKVKNSIQIYDPIQLNLIYSFYVNENIINFEISPKDSCLIINTKTKIEIYELENKFTDYDIKLKYKMNFSKNIENIENLSISTLGDCIAVIDKHKLIKILNKNLEIIKNVKLDVKFCPNNMNIFPLEYFNITYDTKNICICKYNNYNVSLIYKNSNSSNDEVNQEYSEKIVTFKDKILYFKEMQKDFPNYLYYANSSIFFILLENLNFLIMRKMFEADDMTGEIFPDFTILLHLDLSKHTEYINFPYISFSLLYDNQNPIFRNELNNINNYDYNMNSAFQQLGSGIVYSEQWKQLKNKNSLENDSSCFLNLTANYHRNISIDYIVFNLKENLILYKIQGLQSHPYNNPWLESSFTITANDNFSSEFLLLKLTKTSDRKVCVYFLDTNNLIRKFQIINTSNLETSSISDSGKSLKIYSNIVYTEFNDRNRKTMVLEYANSTNEKTTLITFLNSKFEISKLIIFKKLFIKNLKWIENTDFFIFSFNHDEKGVDKCCFSKIGIIYYFSKYLNKKVIEIDEDLLKENFILIDPMEDLRNSIDEYDLRLNKIIHLNLDSIMNLGPHLNKFSNNSSNNSIKFELLLITEENLILCEMCLEPNSSISIRNEFDGKINLKNSENISQIVEKKSVLEGKVLFNNGKIYYTSIDTKNYIFSIKEINFVKHTTIFEVLLLEELLYSNIFFNNYVVFISREYINCYDVSTATYYRVRNDYIKKIPSGNTGNMNLVTANNYSIDLFKFGIFVYLVIITNDRIIFTRIPRNKNKNEDIRLIFNYNFEIYKNNSKIIFRNNMIALNESQIIKLSDITNTSHGLMFECERKQLIMINSNPSSLFDMETFLDFFLSNNEDIVKLILNIFCDLYKNLENFKEAYKNSKMIPNFYKLENINCLNKIIFENDMEIKSESKRKNYNMNQDNMEYQSSDYFKDDKTTEEIEATFHASTIPTSVTSLQYKKTKSIAIANPKLVFKLEEDDQTINPIIISATNNKNMLHLKTVYETLSAENTRNVDNFTKYFILKIMYKSSDLDTGNFKLSTADLCWIHLINDQEYLLKFLSRSSKTGTNRNINWKFMKTFSIPMWIKNDYKLKELFETVGRNEYKFVRENELSNTGDGLQKNFAENVALYFFLAGKHNIVYELFDKENQNEAIRKFIMRDFSIEKNRKLAQKNAGDLINKKKYLFATYFFLLADDMHSALDMTLVHLKDINLTISIIRLYQSSYGNENWKKYYSLDKLYTEYFINYGISIRDPWLTIYGYLAQKKIDLALEYILNYNTNYNFEENKEIIKNLEGIGNDDYIQIITQLYAINVFDYKIFLFAKNLEKKYVKLLEESKANVKSVQNTNFEDIWGMDEDDTANDNQNALADESQNVKEIKIDYSNLSYLALVNSLKRGVIFSPIINLHKNTMSSSQRRKPSSFQDNSNDIELNNYCKDLLKNLICDRIVLDVNFLVDLSEKYFEDIEQFFNYLEDHKILNKKEIYLELNKVFLFLDNYKRTAIPCVRSNKILDTLLTVTNFSEKLIFKNLRILINFNFHENLNIIKVNESILTKITEISEFIYKILKYSSDSDEKNILRNKLKENFDSNSRFQKVEQNLYVFRIFFIFFIYLLFLSKILLSYNKVSYIYDNIKELINEYKKLDKFDEQIQKFYDNINIISTKLNKKISKELTVKMDISKDSPLSFYIQILNISIITTLKNLLSDNLDITNSSLNKYKSNIMNSIGNFHDKLYFNDHHIQEEFKFVLQVLSSSIYFEENFTQNFEKYIKNFVNVSLLYEIHEELKLIYMKNLTQESNFYKYSLIIIKRIFNKQEKLKIFEEKFELKNYVLKYMSRVCKFIKYERADDKEITTQLDNVNVNVPFDFLKVSKESVKIINQIFKNGIDVVNFNDGNHIHDFAINCCDVSNISVALINNGHKKINILNNLLIRRRSEDFIKLLENEPNNTEDAYKTSLDTDFKSLIGNQMYYKYNELMTIIQEEICKKSNNYLFGSVVKLPPKFYDEQITDNYLQDNSTNNITNNSFCKLIESHPLLPIYLTANNRGIISTWSFTNESKKSIDEYYLEKISKESINKIRNLKRLKFNSYGNEFMTIDDLGNVFIFDLECVKTAKLPKITLWQSNNKASNDAIFLNNSGIFSTTYNKANQHYTTLWDFLLPLNQSSIGEIEIGGNIINSISGDSSLIICNDKPGLISFVDLRKFNVISNFQAHLDEIKSCKISERENFMITCGKGKILLFILDGFVKIWDLSLKALPILIESFQPFQVTKDHHKHHMNIELANGLLFASRDGCVKLLRNKIY